MNRILFEQAVELYILGIELVEQHKKLETIYTKGYDTKSSLFIKEYTKLSDLSTRYMQLELAHCEYIYKNNNMTLNSLLIDDNRRKIAG